MRNDLKSLYTATLENMVVIFDTNLMDFVIKLKNIEPNVRNYDYYYREFKKSPVVKFIQDEKEYTFQKVL